MSRVQTVTVEEGEGDQRLDRWIKRRFPQLSQGMIEKMCRKGECRVEGGRVKSSTRLEEGQQVRIPPLPDRAAPPIVRTSVSEADARMIQSCVIYRDDHVIALNKPPGLATQGGSGQTRHVDGLAEALTFGMEEKPRLVHRLDKDTSGVLVVAKTDQAHQHLARQFQEHSVKRQYRALVWGKPEADQGTVDAPLGRHPTRRKDANAK